MARHALEARIALLDGQEFGIRVQPSLLGSELFDLVASRVSLHEKQYFGLCYLDPDTSLELWLDPRSRVIEQTPPKVTQLTLRFGVRFYVPDVTVLREFTTQRLFFRQALQHISSNKLGCPADEVIALCALALQAIEGDYISDSATRHLIDTMKLIPDNVILEHASSLEMCAAKVAEQYKSLEGMDEPSAVLSYMSLVQRLPAYGVHYYEVKDKKRVPWRLGVSPQGLAQYDYTDLIRPRMSYPWSSLINVSFTKTKFYVEMEKSGEHGLGRSNSESFVRPSSRRSLMSKLGGRSQPGQEDTDMLVWTTPSVTYSKQMLEMVIGQHEFHLQNQRARERKLRENRSPMVRRRFPTGFETPSAPQTPVTSTDGRFSPESLPTPTSTLSMSAHLSLTPDNTGMGSASPSTYRARNRRMSIPSVKQVEIPTSATGVRDLLARSADGSSAHSPSLRVLTKQATAASVLSTPTDDESQLERFEKRRTQLLAELARKRRLLERYESEEREYLSRVQGLTASQEDVQKLSHSLTSLDKVGVDGDDSSTSANGSPAAQQLSGDSEPASAISSPSRHPRNEEASAPAMTVLADMSSSAEPQSSVPQTPLSPIVDEVLWERTGPLHTPHSDDDDDGVVVGTVARAARLRKRGPGPLDGSGRPDSAPPDASPHGSHSDLYSGHGEDYPSASAGAGAAMHALDVDGGHPVAAPPAAPLAALDGAPRAQQLHSMGGSRPSIIVDLDESLGADANDHGPLPADYGRVTSLDGPEADFGRLSSLDDYERRGGHAAEGLQAQSPDRAKYDLQSQRWLIPSNSVESLNLDDDDPHAVYV